MRFKKRNALYMFALLVLSACALCLRLTGLSAQQQLMTSKSRLRETFISLVQIDSGSENEEVIGEFVAREMKTLTDEVTIDEAWRKIGGKAGNVIARFHGNVQSQPLLLNAHLDTVMPTVGIKIVEDGEVIRTDGRTILGADDKAGVAIIIEALRTLRERNLKHPPIEVVFTVREEKGLLGAKAFDMKRLSAKYGLVVDGMDEPSVIITRMPSHEIFEVVIKGKTAHASLEPEKGINAIVTASRAIAKLNWGRIDEESTCNVGVINGGRATNVVADTCTVKGEVRSHDIKKLEAMKELITKVFDEEAKAVGASAKVTFERLYRGFTTSHNSPIVLAVVKALTEMGLQPRLKGVEAGSDASVFSEHGIECIVLPTGAANIHTQNEFVDMRKMHMCAELLVRTIINFATLHQ
ncbi:MAG: hypothetical protein HZRFUVUK_001463 [Candidatus Fervidibacterota bacterium]